MFAPGWQQKWLLLALVLGYAFLNRFRLLGLALAKLLTLKLARDRDAAPLQVAVQVESARFGPLELRNVRFSSGDRWSIEFSRITLRSFVREFFRSFGQVRILALEVEAVNVRIGDLDDEYVGSVLRSHQQQSDAKRSRKHSTCE